MYASEFWVTLIYADLRMIYTLFTVLYWAALIFIVITTQAYWYLMIYTDL